MTTPTLFQCAVLILASGRVSYSLTQDTIFEETRHWVYTKSSPHGATVELPDGRIAPWRMMHPIDLSLDAEYIAAGGDPVTEWAFDPQQELRTPGFWGQLVECFYCLSFWVSLTFAALFVIAPDFATVLLAPFALWGASTLVAKVTHS